MKRLLRVPVSIVAALAVCLAFVLGGGILAPTVARAENTTYDFTKATIQLWDDTTEIAEYNGSTQQSYTYHWYTYDGNTKSLTVKVYYPLEGGGSRLLNSSSYSVSGTTSAMNAGTYTVTATGKGGYEGSVSVTWTINKMHVDYSTIPRYDNPTYDGTEQAVPIQPTFTAVNTTTGTQLVVQPSDYVLTTYDPLSDPHFETPVTPINAGSYVTRVAWSENGNFEGTVETVNWQIEKADLSVSVAQDGTLTYDGTAQTAIVNLSATSKGNQQVTVNYSTTGGETGIYTFFVPSFTNAGTYTVYYKATADNHNDATGSFTVTINKADASAEVKAIENLVYTGQMQDLVTVGTITGGTTINYSGYTDQQGEWNYSDPTPPKRTEAGTYYVHYKITADDSGNYQDATGTVEVTIANATLTNVSVAQTGTLTYDGTAQTATVSASATSVNNQEVTFTYRASEDDEYTTTVPSFTEAGEHTVYYKASAPNHNDATGSFTVTIDPKDISGATITLGTNPTYNGSQLGMNVVSVTMDDVTGDVTYSVNSGYYGTDAKEYLLEILGYGNFTGSATKSWSILPASLSGATITLADDPVYTGDEQTMAVESVTVSGVTGDVTYTVTGNTGTEVGGYELTISGTGNFSESQTARWKILPAALTEVSVVQDGTLTYTGEPLTATVKATATAKGGQEVTFTYRANEEDEYAEAVPAFTEVGTYTVYYKATAANHEVATGSFEVTIDPKDISGATITLGTNPTYDGTEQSVTINSVTIADVTGDVTYNVTNDSDKGTNAGDYTLTIDGTGNFTGTATAEWRILKAGMTYTTPIAAAGLVYDGQAHKLATSGSVAVGGTLSYSTDGGQTWSEEVPTATEAGSYQVGWKIEPDANHQGGLSDSFVATIAKADPWYSVQAAALTYDGQDQPLLSEATTTDGTIEFSLDGATWSPSVPTGKDAGIYTVYFRVVGDTNHNDYSDKVDVLIANAKLTGVSVAQDGALAYTGEAQTATVVTTATAKGDQTVTFAYSATEDGDYAEAVPAFTEAGTYTVYYKATAPNHEDATGSFEVTVGAAALTDVSVEQVGRLTYNGKAQRAAVRATATARGDQLVTFTYSATKDGTYTSAVPAFTEPGTHVVYFRASAPNHLDYEGSFEVVIAKPAAADKSGKPAQPGKPGIPYTGDATPAAASLAALAAAGGVAVVVGRRLKRDCES